MACAKGTTSHRCNVLKLFLHVRIGVVVTATAILLTCTSGWIARMGNTRCEAIAIGKLDGCRRVDGNVGEKRVWRRHAQFISYLLICPMDARIGRLRGLGGACWLISLGHRCLGHIGVHRLLTVVATSTFAVGSQKCCNSDPSHPSMLRLAIEQWMSQIQPEETYIERASSGTVQERVRHVGAQLRLRLMP